MILSYTGTLILPMSQLETQQLMTSHHKLGNTEYLIQTYTNCDPPFNHWFWCSFYTQNWWEKIDEPNWRFL